ncbi:hypothetical protein BDN72DRAFT_944159 [Pluteus cervinus]|uniref:Uncharacterized protein n=1 Tax=Pluteus cervinus TaxID=181527 RepID=A0ACD3A2X1_9AGAR|nr:hypothetical protein BDN72DRAFT_944159 [Pluteus cervinus]
MDMDSNPSESKPVQPQPEATILDGPIRHIPPELLCEILVLATTMPLPPGSTVPHLDVPASWPVIGVKRSWQELIEANPGAFLSKFVINSLESASSIEAGFNRYIRRISGAKYLIDIEINQGRGVEMTGARKVILDRILYGFRMNKADLLSRLRSLKVHTFTPLPSLELFNWNLVCLQKLETVDLSLEWENHNLNNIWKCFHHAQSLRCVKWHSYIPPFEPASESSVITSLPRLTRIEMNEAPVDTLGRYFSLTTAIEHFCIQRITQSPGPQFFTQTIPLAALQSLIIEDSENINLLFETLLTPALTELTLGNIQPGSYHSLVNLLQRSQNKLRSLTLKFPRGFDEDELLMAIASLLPFLEGIRDLSLDLPPECDPVVTTILLNSELNTVNYNDEITALPHLQTLKLYASVLPFRAIGDWVEKRISKGRLTELVLEIDLGGPSSDEAETWRPPFLPRKGFYYTLLQRKSPV